MAVAQEVIERILHYHPVEGHSRRIDLGEIEEGICLVWDTFPYQKRFTLHPTEPLIIEWTRQPVLALVGRDGGGAIPLAYRRDIENLRDPLVTSIASRLIFFTQGR
ncbi:hypothetical protein HYU96_01050 [Candidatus Daviesbacteria bacterium]|nr:hypothetical protein [Candidatus Daviesbacteria bacterium]